MHNKAKSASAGADRPAVKDSFGKKGQPKKHNMAPPSKDKERQPVSEDAGEKTPTAEKVAASEYDPASGKRAKSIADLRSAQKKINEAADADGDPTGSEGGQDGKHSSSKNATGYMKAGMGKMDKQSKKKPTGLAKQTDPEMDDPMDEDMEDNDQTEEGMTPSGKKRVSSLKELKQKIAKMNQD